MTWIFAYFRQHYAGRVEIDEHGTVHVVPGPHQPFTDERLHYAHSEDGRQWTPLNGNRAIWSQSLRDPFIARGPDGLFHLVATDASSRRTCLYARSRDLVQWSDVRSLPLMERIPRGFSQHVNNIWAPEWIYDRAASEYFVFWSSSFADSGWRESRLWCARSKDLVTFSEPSPLFDPPYSVIDGSLLLHNGTWYLFHKEEEFGVRKGERRAIRLATSSRLDGPYQLHQGDQPGGAIAPTITEGPCVMPDPQGDGWLLLYDFCMAGCYGASRSTDLRHWTPVDNTRFPDAARHGSVIAVSDREFAAVRAGIASLSPAAAQ